jgi:hypothetical protein
MRASGAAIWTAVGIPSINACKANVDSPRVEDIAQPPAGCGKAVGGDLMRRVAVSALRS